MTPKAVISLSILATVVMTAISTGVSMIRIRSLEVKVDTIWSFLVRRAVSEGVQKGMMEMNSPVAVSPESRALLSGMEWELRDFYDRVGAKLSDVAAMLEIEKRFGGRLLREVCTPHRMDKGECLVIALAVAKGVGSTIEIPD